MEKFFKIFKNTEDLSLKLKSFSTPSVGFELLSTDSFYIGYEKFFRQFFVSFESLNTSGSNLSFTYFNGSTWSPLKVLDESFSFSKDGFVTFEPPTDWKSTAVNGESLFYIKISTDIDFTPTTKLTGLSILFSNDDDLVGIRSDIVSKYNKGKTWVVKHEEAKKQIIQKIRNAGHRKITARLSNSTLFFGNDNSIYFDNINEFDLFNPFELRQASKYLTMSLIYLHELTDSSDDKFEKAGKHYYALYQEAIDLFMLKLDIDNDGVENSKESEEETGIKLSWL